MQLPAPCDGLDGQELGPKVHAADVACIWDIQIVQLACTMIALASQWPYGSKLRPSEGFTSATGKVKRDNGHS